MTRKSIRTINTELLKHKVRMMKCGRKQIAEAVECSPHTVSNWLRPDYEWGLAEYHAHKVAAFLGVNVDELFPLVAAEKKAS